MYEVRTVRGVEELGVDAEDGDDRVDDCEEDTIEWWNLRGRHGAWRFFFFFF